MMARSSARALSALCSQLRPVGVQPTSISLSRQEVFNPKMIRISEFSTTLNSLKSKELDLYSEDGGFLKRAYRRVFHGGSSVPKYQLARSGYDLLYVCSAKVDVVKFFDHFGLADTYFSWFLVTELHVWMLLVRLNVGKSKEGRFLRNFIIEALWEDMDARAKMVATMSSSDRMDQIWDLAEEFQTALLLYDVGVIGSDKDLANALWKRVYNAQDNVDPEKLEMMVKYVRKTLVLLDDMNVNDLYYYGKNHILEWPDVATVAKE